MANFVLVFDSDPARRAAFVAAVQKRIAPLPNLVISKCAGADWAIVWAAGVRAPVSWVSDSDGGAVLWGEAIDEQGHRQSASELRSAWKNDGGATWDGYYAAVTIEREGSITAGADVLGTYPVYYWQGPGVILVGSSIDSFAAHTAFRARLDLRGLVGVLLTNGLVEGRSVWEGVRRLAAGHQLRVRNGLVTESRTYSVPENDELRALPLPGHVALLGEALASTLRRHSPAGESCGLLLSGGLDSRILAGYLAEQGTQVHALTFGLPRDVELRCAQLVTAELGFKHDSTEIPFEAYASAADALARWESLAAGFCGVHEWAAHPYLDCLPPRIVLGHILDGVVGGIHISWAYDPATRSMSFDPQFERTYRWGFAPDPLRELLVPPARALVEDVTACLRTSYRAYSERPHLRAWHYDLLHRHRFHIGSALWAACFSSWPVCPALDRQLLAVSASIPASSLADRRAQKEILVTRFPRLAALPIDRNSYCSLPLRPRLRHHVREFCRQRLSRVTRALTPAREGRYYYRAYDLDSPGWVAVRRAAESWRRRLPDALRPEVVDSWLPAPNQALSLDDRIMDSSRLKLLLGMACLVRHHHFG